MTADTHPARSANRALLRAALAACLACAPAARGQEPFLPADAPAARGQEPFLPVDAPVPLGTELLALAKGAQIVSFGVVASVDLPAVTAAEVLGGGGAAVNLGTFTPGADVTGGVLLQTQLQRTVDTVWAAWIRDLKKVQKISVQYDVVGARGSTGRLDADDPAAGAVAVQVTPLTPKVLWKVGRWRYVVGGAVFTVDLADARGAGRYAGNLFVTVFTL